MFVLIRDFRVRLRFNQRILRKYESSTANTMRSHVLKKVNADSLVKCPTGGAPKGKDKNLPLFALWATPPFEHYSVQKVSPRRSRVKFLSAQICY